MGEWDSISTEEIYPFVDHKVSSIDLHPEFNSRSLYNDLALMFLEKPVGKYPHIGTVCLPEQNYNFDNKRCFVSGWGKKLFGVEGSSENILKKVELPIIPSDRCQDMLRETKVGKRFELHESFICAGGEEGKGA